MNIDYPYQVDSIGRTADAPQEDHIRNLMEQVLFTAPGERVNRPTFGSGLLQLLFLPMNDALTATVQLSISGALQQWLGNLIRVEDVQVQNEDSTLRISVSYTVIKTLERRTAQFVRGA